MADEPKTVEQAIEALAAVSKVKQADPAPGAAALPPDKKLGEQVAKAISVIQAEQKKLTDQTSQILKMVQATDPADGGTARKPAPEPRFKGFSGVYGGASADASFDSLIRKRAGKDDVELRKFHEWNDDVLLAALAMGSTPERVIKRVPEFSQFLSEELQKTTGELSKALAAATSGAGAEWIPEIFSPDLVDLIRVERVLVNAFRRMTLQSGTQRLNQLTQEMQAFVVAESTSNNVFTVPSIVSDPGTANIILTAIELAVASVFSKTFEEDSIVPALPEIRRRIIEGMAKGVEDATINASTEVTHPDSDVVAGAAATAWSDSLRGIAQGSDFTTLSATVQLDGVNMTADNVLRLKLLQGRFGAKDSDNKWVTSPQGLVKLFGLRDANSNQILLRVDTFGARAVLLTGSVASLFGSDVIVSDLVKTNLNSSGVVPPTPEDRTELIRFNKEAFLFGDRRMLTIESDTLPLTRQRVMVATERLILRRVKPSQSTPDRPVTIGLNIETT